MMRTIWNKKLYEEMGVCQTVKWDDETCEKIIKESNGDWQYLDKEE